MSTHSDLFVAVRFFLSESWRFLTHTEVPGTSITFAALFVGLFLADLGLRFLFVVLNAIFPMGMVPHVLKASDSSAWSTGKIRRSK